MFDEKMPPQGCANSRDYRGGECGLRASGALQGDKAISELVARIRCHNAKDGATVCLSKRCESFGNGCATSVAGTFDDDQARLPDHGKKRDEQAFSTLAVPAQSAHGRSHSGLCLPS